ncbi:MAG: hypothetical protein FJ395_09585 [Verrucomicrobia bacterium]|nr:hypothetical protein [Verrucomicrobiota bacterium]
MRDRKLEQNIRRLELLIERWKQLSQYLDRGFQPHDIEAREESSFLDLKSGIAREYELLMTTLGTISERDEKVLRLLNVAPSLQSLREMEEGMDKKVVGDWHSAFIAMQALLGRLRGRQATLAGVSSFRMGLIRVFGNPLILLAFVIAAGYGIYRFVDEWAPKLQYFLEQNK